MEKSAPKQISEVEDGALSKSKEISPQQNSK